MAARGCLTPNGERFAAIVSHLHPVIVCLLSALMLRVRARISWHFGGSAGRADARRRHAGDVVTSARSGNAADARPPPRPAGLRIPDPADWRSPRVMIQLGLGAAAKCQVILARALNPHFSSAETAAVDIVFLDLVIEDSFGGTEQPSGFGPVAAGSLQRVLNQVLFIGGNCFA